MSEDLQRPAATRVQPPAGSQQGRFLAWCLTPGALALAFLALVPMVLVVVLGFTSLDLTRPASWWDFSDPTINYSILLQDGRFLNSLWVQAKLTVGTVLLQVGLGLALALLFAQLGHRHRVLQTALLLPMVLPPIVVAVIWKLFYTPDNSPVYWALAAVGLRPAAVITNPQTALAALVVADAWEWFAFSFLMFFAAIQTLPAEQIEAALVDGAAYWARVRFIVLPHLRNTLLVCVVLRVIESVKAFPLIYVLTSGGPGNVTEVTNFYSFVQAFNFSYVGSSSAISTVMLAATALLSAIAVVRLWSAREGASH